MIADVLFSIYFYCFLFLSGIIYLFVMALLFCWGLLFDPKLRAVQALSQIISMSYFWVSPGWKIKLTGKQNVDPKQTYVVISNHQAMLDIALLYVVPLFFKWISKKEVYKIPFFGWILFLRRDIAVDRGSAASTKKMIKDCMTCLQQGISIIIFPEGTRSKSESIGTFREGAFLIAKMAKVDIVPVIIKGTFNTAKSKILLPWKQTFEVHILPPICYEQYGSKKIGEITQEMEVHMKAAHSNVGIN